MEVTATAAPAGAATVARAGKYLTFSLADEHYGLDIVRVQEIVGLLPVTRVPRLPDFVAGVVNLRGRVIPVIDLRLSFGMPASALEERTCIVIVSIERPDGSFVTRGAIVDEVSDVVAFSEGAIEATPEFGTSVDTSFITGVGRVDDRVVLLLDIDKVLTTGELEELDRAAAAPVAGAEGVKEES